MKYLLIILTAIFSCFNLSAQTNSLYGGLGIGLHYGGIGVNLSASPLKYVGMELGIGYNLVNIGVDGGVYFKFLPDRKFCPDIGFLYGYNAAIIVKDNDKYTKVYYGPSIAGGFKIYNTTRKMFWNFQVVRPFRSQEFEDDFNNPNLKFDNEPWPVAFSIGIHFTL